MLREIKGVIEDYAIVGFIIGLLSVIIRPFVSIKQSLRDVAITFVISLLTGLLLEYWDIPQEVKCGISGVCGLFAVRLYMIIEVSLSNIEKNPIDFFKKVKK